MVGSFNVKIKSKLMKLLNFWVTSVFLILTISMIHAQYNYNDYRFPDVKVRGLDMELRLAGQGTSRERLSGSTNNLHYNISGDYFQLTNSQKTQKTDYFSVFNSSERYYQDLGTFDFYWRTIADITKSQINRNYYKQDASFLGLKGKFWEIDHTIHLDFYNGDSFINPISGARTPYKETNISAEFPIKMGFGRIEPVREVFLAQFLMDDLLKEGIISEKFTQEQLFELAQLMADVSNRRIFDFRRFNIYQLTRLADWLASQGIENDIKSFAILNDNWNYAFTNLRRQGKRISYGINPWIYYFWETFGSNKNNANVWGIDVNFEYINIKNRSQRIQREWGLDIASNIFYKEEGGDYTRLSSNLGLFYGWTYTPNSRTTLSFLPRIDYTYDLKQSAALNLDLPLSINYFINDRMRLIGTFIYRTALNDDQLSYRPMGGQEFNNNFLRSLSPVPQNEFSKNNETGNYWFFNATFRYNMF